ncbi:MAG: hypothetical protein HQ514_20070 [Rhodospirillales bacterium]|nr:hypothetical protein [Rhodospirillales bacterium]
MRQLESLRRTGAWSILDEADRWSKPWAYGISGLVSLALWGGIYAGFHSML